jgi:hypothetical protein
MRISLVIISIFFSFSLFAQPTVSGRTSPAKDTVVILPTSSITLTGTAVRANPGHPILDTSWVKTSGPAATITNPSNRMTTTVTGLVAGVYIFTLTATDKQNAASASVTVKVISGILPVELAYFNAFKNDKGIELEWQTDIESNNAYFVVQKSANGSGFYDIARIDSKAKNGNSSTQLNYSYQINTEGEQADMHLILPVLVLLTFVTLISKLNKFFKSLLLGIACLLLFSCNKSVTTPNQVSVSSKTAFRLKQIDIDGNIHYSEIKILN